MKNLKKLAVLAALVAAALSFAPKTASARDWCGRCAVLGSCIDCCKCAGYDLYYCANVACP